MRLIKQQLLFATCLLFGLKTQSQIFPPGISYQAVVRNINGDELSNSAVSIEFSVRKNTLDGPVIFDENHNLIQTNQFGLFSAIIGTGVNTGMGFFTSLEDIDWGEDDYFLEVRAVIPGQGTAQVLGVSQLLAVPYAHYALKAESVINESDGSPQNELITALETPAENTIAIIEGGVTNNYDVSAISYATWSKANGAVYNNQQKIGIGTSTPGSDLEVNGCYAAKVVKVETQLYDMNAADPNSEHVHVLLCNVTNNHVTINLPSATSCAGRMYKFRKYFAGANTSHQVNLVPASGQLIDELASYSMSHSLAEYLTIISDGTGWFLIDHAKE